MGARAIVAATIAELVSRVVAAARSGDHVLCMSNGGFGGVHEKLLEALAPPGRRRGMTTAGARAGRRRADHPPALPARLPLVAAIDQGAQARGLGARRTGPT